MGTQGENSTLDRYLGSVAANVMNSAYCSVIVVPESADFSNEIEMGYATDFSEADPFELWRAVKLLQPFKPKHQIFPPKRKSGR